ncbi:MAG: hypothetical protein MUE85_06970 [Microscillaceae bacterium]|jgi:hypothetical protein|nr:hypothetical protein [Microscillaceae bacterium]
MNLPNPSLENSTAQYQSAPLTSENQEWQALTDLFSARTTFVKESQEFVRQAKILLENDQKTALWDLLVQFIQKH